MRYLVVFELRRALGSILLTALVEGALIIPPHDLSPVGLEVLQEFSVILQVLSYSYNYVVVGGSWCLGQALVPLAPSEVESTHSEGNVDDGSLFSPTRLQVDSTELGVLVAGNQ